jgi:hypothetical protein
MATDDGFQKLKREARERFSAIEKLVGIIADRLEAAEQSLSETRGGVLKLGEQMKGLEMVLDAWTDHFNEKHGDHEARLQALEARLH